MVPGRLLWILHWLPVPFLTFVTDVALLGFGSMRLNAPTGARHSMKRVRPVCPRYHNRMMPLSKFSIVTMLFNLPYEPVLHPGILKRTRHGLWSVSGQRDGMYGVCTNSTSSSITPRISSLSNLLQLDPTHSKRGQGVPRPTILGIGRA